MDDAVEENLVAVDFDLPFPVQISSQPLDVDVRGIRCTLRFEKVRRENLDPRLRLSGRDFDLLEDRFGWVRYSKVTVSIPLDQLPPVPLGIKQDEWPIEIAISAVNNFLGHYRELLNLPWVRLMNPTEVWAADVTYRERGSLPQTISFRRMHQIKPPIVGIADEQEKALREHLKKTQRASSWKLLLLDAEDALSRGDTRLAVILGQTAIEGAVCEVLIHKFRESQAPLDKVRTELKVGKKALSYESAVERATIDLKLSKGLQLATGNGLDEDATLWYEWDIANAMRVACVHHAHFPPLKEARTVLDTYWRVYRERLDQQISNWDAVTTDWVSGSISAVIQALGQHPSKSLYDVMKKTIPALQKRVVFYHIGQLPISMERGDRIGMAEAKGDLLAIWIDPDRDFDMNEVFIAGTLFCFDLLSKGYPRAKVSDTLPPEVGRAGWKLVSETLTQSVLQLHVYNRLKKAGFTITKLAKESLETTKRQLLAPDYAAPDSNAVAARTLPLNVMALYFSLEKDSAKQELIKLIAERAPGYINDVECLLKAVQQTGYETREKCIQLMVRCRNCLVMLDSCLIVDPKDRLVYYSSGPQPY
ncbi:MAG: hypothetical protein A2Y59_04160 [Chloroflexi bacterium RBG_13_52_14]|nr:MAG: hypothetical protein A2Y59_04160 [Chloroflexi bacterium RBG_13_52_14]